MRVSIAIAAVVLLVGAAPNERPNRMSKSDNGLSVELSVGSGELREGDQVDVALAIRDAGGTALSGIGPKVWFGSRAALDERGCTEKVANFTAGGLFHQPALDLNVFHVVALNADATITVVDPRFSFGGTRLLGMTELPAPGVDWVLDDARNRIFVAMPKTGQVAVVNTADWKLLATLDAGANASRVLLQKDGGYVWAAYDGGVVAIDPRTLEIAGRVATGRGPHDLALSEDDGSLFVTNAEDGTTSLIDVRAKKSVGTYPTGARPVSVAWASRGARAYVVSADGAIFSVDAKQRAAKPVAQAAKGTSRIRFAPAGRFAFVANPEADAVYILDTAIDRVVQTARVEKRPFEITFSDTTAYVRHENSETVLMLPLAVAGTAGAPVSVSDFPGGERPFGASAGLAADGVVRAPGEHAVLVANPADGNIYYYKEGMAAPMGHFSNYKHAPRALLVLDRSLREKTSGLFQTSTKLPPAGKYDVAIALDSPRVVTCFQIAIKGNAQDEKRRKTYPVLIQQLTPKTLVNAGEPMRLRFRLVDPNSGKPRAGLPDVRALIFRAPGTWHDRVELTAGEDGNYTTDFVVPQEGTYYVYLESPAAGLQLNNHQYLVFRAGKG